MSVFDTNPGTKVVAEEDEKEGVANEIKFSLNDLNVTLRGTEDSLYLDIKNKSTKRIFSNCFAKSTLESMQLLQPISQIISMIIAAHDDNIKQVAIEIAYIEAENVNKANSGNLRSKYMNGDCLCFVVKQTLEWNQNRFIFKLLEKQRKEADVIRDVIQDLQSKNDQLAKELQSKNAEFDRKLQQLSAEFEKKLESKSAEFEKKLESKSAEFEKKLESKSRSQSQESEKKLESKTNELKQKLRTEFEKKLQSQSADFDGKLQSKNNELKQKISTEFERKLQSQKLQQKLQSQSDEFTRKLNAKFNESQQITHEKIDEIEHKMQAKPVCNIAKWVSSKNDGSKYVQWNEVKLRPQLHAMIAGLENSQKDAVIGMNGLYRIIFRYTSRDKGVDKDTYRYGQLSVNGSWVAQQVHYGGNAFGQITEVFVLKKGDKIRCLVANRKGNDWKECCLIIERLCDIV